MNIDYNDSRWAIKLCYYDRYQRRENIERRTKNEVDGRGKRSDWTGLEQLKEEVQQRGSSTSLTAGNVDEPCCVESRCNKVIPRPNH